MNETKWLQERRRVAWEAYKSALDPDRTSHLWKYSDPIIFELNGKEILTEKTKPVFLTSDNLLKNKIVLLELNEAFKLCNDKLQEKFGELICKTPTKITYLNEAIWASGFFLFVPRGLKVDDPILIKSISSFSNKLYATRALIILEEDASISLVDESSSTEVDNFSKNVIVEIFLAQGSKFNYINLQTNGKKTVQHLLQRANVARDAELNNLIVSLGGKQTKADLGTTLSGEGASITTYGIVLGSENQKFDHHTIVEHMAQNTKSSLNFRVVLNGKAQSAYTGNLKISQNANKSDAYQENRNLLLSTDAKAESIPELEILTNDVIRCSHGVTVGQVDKEQVYYLNSRGLSLKEAERIIVEGFIEPTISRIPEGELKENIISRVQNKLRG